MSAAKHTPGPWFAFLGDEGSFDIGNLEDQDLAAVLCSRYKWVEEKDVMHANAHLMAAAPDLLAALIAIVESLEEHDDEGMIGHAQPMIDARAAIKKATGAAA